MNQLIKGEFESLEESWETLLKLLPQNWEAEAEKKQAIRRTLRKFPSMQSMLRFFLITPHL